MKLRKCMVCVVLIGVASCKHEVVRPPQDHYRLLVTDNPEDTRFELMLSSMDERALCITVQQWPNQLGQLHMGSAIASLNTSEGVLPAEDENFGYCPGGCGLIRIAPGADLHGFIAYAAFGDPMRIAADAARKLTYSVKPHYCQYHR